MKNNNHKKVSTLQVLQYSLKQLVNPLKALINRISLNPKKYFSKKNQHRLTQYGLLMRVDKPIGTLLLLWPTYWALWLASNGTPSFLHLFVFSSGVFLMRSAGCVINDYADRNIDGQVKRTKNRPLALGTVSEKEALLLFIFLALIAFCLVLLLNTLSIILSFFALAIATIYPFMKRVTYFPQVVLGMAFSMAIPMAFAAVQNEIPEIAWLLYVTNLMWVLAYDTLYGMVDKQDDLKIGVKSTAIFFGEADLQITATIQSMFIFGMILIGSRADLNAYFYVSLLIASGLITWQIFSSRNRDTSKCFKAFLNNNWVGFVIFCGVFISQMTG